MAHKDPAAVTETWATRLGAATTEITAGVNGVTVAPGQLAARHADLWLARVQAAKNKWAKNVASVDLATWKNDMLTKGVPRIAQGAAAAKPKMQQFMTQFLPYVDQGVSKVKAMPKNGIEDSIARAAAMIRHNAAFQRNRTS